MVINGKEYGFAYTVWAHCEYNDWIVKNPKSSYARAVVQKAAIMSKAYHDIHGEGEIFNPKDVMNLPAYIFNELLAETDAAEERDSKRTVESAPSAKNAESSEK